MEAFWMGVGTMVIYSATALGSAYLTCYGFIGHWPMNAWYLIVPAAIGGLIKWHEAAKKAE